MRRDEHRVIGTAAFSKVVIPDAILLKIISVTHRVEENFPIQGPPQHRH